MINRKGRLVVIDGLDGTGKATQVEMLKEYLIKQRMVYDKDFTIVDFPRYKQESCHMVESYLAGKFGDDPNMIDPYTSSMFYAIDRAISYKTENWGRVYDNGGLVIADRYTSSNVIHQAGKLKSNNSGLSAMEMMDDDQFYRSADFCDFIKWLYTTEYDKIGIPTPNLIIYLKLSEEANTKLMQNRIKTENHFTDIHESNNGYLNSCRKALDAYQKLMSDTNIRIRTGVNDNTYKIRHAFIQEDNYGEIMTKEQIHNKIKKTIIDNFII